MDEGGGPDLGGCGRRWKRRGGLVPRAERPSGAASPARAGRAPAVGSAQEGNGRLQQVNSSVI